MSKVLRIVAVRVASDPVIEELEDSLSAMQKFVGGYIEAVTVNTEKYPHCITLWCNEMGKFECQANRLLALGGEADVLHGDFFLCAVDMVTGENASLTEEEAAELVEEVATWRRVV